MSLESAAPSRASSFLSWGPSLQLRPDTCCSSWCAPRPAPHNEFWAPIPPSNSQKTNLVIIFAFLLCPLLCFRSDLHSISSSSDRAFSSQVKIQTLPLDVMIAPAIPNHGSKSDTNVCAELIMLRISPFECFPITSNTMNILKAKSLPLPTFADPKSTFNHSFNLELPLSLKIQGA